ncbi:GW dipeptide domain-containing protein [Salinicoccus luteus]|uniref:GW dipeptide domain-containing protein n=1 Tax=Salinicoccus luteus TaxID=367840 RepID=UPI0004E0E772|nr:GW dipeptide domain-containing protein [Salinicoccus luteus]
MDSYGRFIKNFNLAHFIWVEKRVNTSILQSPNEGTKVDSLLKYHGDILKVIDMKTVDKKEYALLQNQKKVLGWADIRNMPTVYSKPLEYVKLNIPAFIEEQSHQFFVVEKEKMKFLKSQMLESRFIMMKSNRLYEAIYKNGKLQGWFTTKVLYRSKEVSIHVTDIRSNATFYSTNDMTREIDVDVQKLGEVKILRVFKEVDLARIKTDSGKYWTRLHYLNTDSVVLNEDIKEPQFSEIVVYDLIRNMKRERREVKRLMRYIQVKDELTNRENNIPALSDEVMVHRMKKENLEAEIEKEIKKQNVIRKQYENLKKSLLGRIHGLFKPEDDFRLKRITLKHLAVKKRGE